MLAGVWSREKRSCAPRSVCILALFNLAVADSLIVISELAQLFWDLEHSDVASITPTMDLAKLALVTSKDEEDDIEQTATDSSNDTDATLVEDTLPRAGTLTSSPVGSPRASSSSVLGKRSREKEIGSRMSIDSVTDKDNYVIISKNPDAGPSGVGGGGDSETEMKDVNDIPAPAPPGAKPPPLPPRKIAESVMMFGAILSFGSFSGYFVLINCHVVL